MTNNLPDNEVFIDEDFETVWDRTVKSLSKDFFVINNIEKDSRLINVSFSSQTPEDYVDCGRSLRTFKNLRGEQTFFYYTAENTEYAQTLTNGIAVNTRRRSSLDGRGNIYIAPENNGTTVTANFRYNVSVKLSGTTFDGRPVSPQDFVWSFNSKDVFRDSNPEGDLYCVARGVLEGRVLDAAKGL